MRHDGEPTPGEHIQTGVVGFSRTRLSRMVFGLLVFVALGVWILPDAGFLKDTVLWGWLPEGLIAVVRVLAGAATAVLFLLALQAARMLVFNHAAIAAGGDGVEVRTVRRHFWPTVIPWADLAGADATRTELRFNRLSGHAVVMQREWLEAGHDAAAVIRAIARHSPDQGDLAG